MVRVLYASRPRVEQLAGRLYFLYLETTCISCVENRYTVLQIAKADNHAYLEVVMSSIQKESESTLVVGFI